MDPTRKTEINGMTIKEFYWAGDLPCYVDHALATVGYDEAVSLAQDGKPIPMDRDLASVT